ncbi:polysaccharide lyase family 7 protein [Micromonospora sp. CNB394]|uniref:polysaccharide lyase family 7 protein n=1 Tax=Micromonospora sp. CNB394 TaxID=1169151 RepID=UPI00039E9443|nr:polysaccharide lyase family 7 protein [Micromonospora sp. CNB394]
MQRKILLGIPVALVVVGAAAVTLPAQATTGVPVSSMTASTHDGNVPANTVDGDLSTRWSGKGDGAWIRYDLGSSAKVASIGIAWHRGDQRKSTFLVQASADAKSWQTVVARRESSGKTTDFEVYDFTDRAARYVQVVGFGNSENNWNSISEAAVYAADGDTGTEPGSGDTGTEPGSGSGGTGTDCASPSDVLDLTNWKVTLPTGSGSSPTEIKQPALKGYTVSPSFVASADCASVQFQAPVNGVTTSGSSYPRSELREMANNGSSQASWSSTSGTHTMVAELAFDALPQVKPHLVGAQIHDGGDDITVFRLEGTNLYVTNGDDSNYKLVTSDYKLGTRFEAKFVVSGGQVKAYYNGQLQTTITKSFSGAYFKAGAYTQANCSKSSPCSSSNYGQTSIYKLTVTHS